MIEKVGENYRLVCDVCALGEDGEFEFNTFDEAVEYKKDHDWVSHQFLDGEWEDICPDCAELEGG